MDPRIKIIYIRQLKGPKTATIKGQASLIPSRIKEWSGHSMYTNLEILNVLKLGIRWHNG